MSIKNAVLFKENSMSETNLSPKEIVGRVAKHIMEKNPPVKPHFQPYIKQKGIRFSAPQSFIHVDLSKLYPEAKPGNTVFVGTKIRVPENQNIAVLINGNVKSWLNGKCMFSSFTGEAKAENGYEVKRIDAVKQVTTVDTAWYCEVETIAGASNELIVEALCTEEGFFFDLNLSHTENVTVWATDYLTWVREESPLSELAGEEGMAISPLYTDADVGEKNFFKNPAYTLPKVQPEGTDFELSKLFNSGNIAYGYTEAIMDTKFALTAYAPLRIFVNGACVLETKCGNTEIPIKKGDRILIKCLKENEKWGFSVADKTGLGLPFVNMSEKRDLRFLFCGGFSGTGLHTKLAPEFAKSFATPFTNEKGEKIYWRFSVEETYLRAYLNSSFYGHWYYANMLCLYGMYMTGKTLDNEACDSFFYDGMKQMADFVDYIRMDKERYVSAAFMAYSTNTIYLDHIGTMGMNFIEAYFKSGDSIFVPVIERLRKGIDEDVPRFSDGTFCRMHTNTMWADDLYMSCPFLVRLGRYTGDNKYYDEAAKQLLGFKKRLYMPEEKIMSHIFFIKEKTSNCIPWGRGNGWVAVALAEVLEYLPEDNFYREEILAFYREFMDGLCACQDECGMWHQLINKPETYLETSGTAMFMLSLLRGVRYGWIDESYAEPALKAWNALKEYSISKDGVIYNICMGSSCSMEERYYTGIPTIADDDHGTGVILMAINELIMWEKEKGGR